MTESFLHHLWKLKIFNSGTLITTDGESLVILHPGQHNSDAGPDFFSARIRIGETLWAGNVEIHLKSSDWNVHAHTGDPVYDTVILHVVHEHDAVICRNDGSAIPTFELKDKFDPRLWKNYQDLLHSDRWIPCEDRIDSDEFTWHHWIDRLLAERLEKKLEVIYSTLDLNHENWEEAFYQQLARNFGFRLNALPFEMLAKSLPMAHLARHKDHLEQVEALLFGQAGMLGKKFRENYPARLRKEYLFLKKKFNLQNSLTTQWKFLRLRPPNFPTIRIAQFAQLIHHSSHLFAKIMDCENLEVLKSYFDVEASIYWKNHYVFDKPSEIQSGHIGSETIDNLLINSVVPFLFAYGRRRHSEEHEKRALKFLEEIPAEKNSIIEHWLQTGIVARSAYDSQALIHLKNDYCNEKKCLTCAIGNRIINRLS